MSAAPAGQPHRETLAEILLRIGIVTEEDLAKALPRCDEQQRNLLAVLAEMGVAGEETLLKAVSVRQKVPYFTTFEGLLDPQCVVLIPEKMARKSLVVPIRTVKDSLLVAMVNPMDVVALDMVAAHTGRSVKPVLTTRTALFRAINEAYGKINPAKAAGFQTPPGGPAPAPAAPGGKRTSKVRVLPKGADSPLAMRFLHDTSVVDLVDSLLAEAIASGCSDIHLEPTAINFRMRLRVDGILQDRRVFPKELESAMVARIKILSKLDITEVRLPQDGHISVDYSGRSIDLRVSSLPGIYGEKVVIRILDQSKNRKTIKDLGLPPDVETSFANVVRRPMGLLLVTGPTGSGKTTTLYAVLGDLNTTEKNIVTLEDPVEGRIPGLNQIETNERIGFTFAKGLRAILRQDPNVILVGEMRDAETALIGVQASVTGHMVLSTLHTKDSIGTVARLLNMGVERFLLASALTGVMAQRLVRVLCQRCKKAEAPDASVLKRLNVPFQPPGPVFEPVGCEACGGQGYVGRTAVYEWLYINKALRVLISEGASEAAFKDAARAAGLRTLQEAGLEKVYAGLTSVEEVVRVTTEEDVE